MEMPVLGKLIEGEAFRDAIHVAIAPVIASHYLHPGEHIGFVPGSRESVRCTDGNKDAKSIGIVDPFIRHGIEAGQRFFMLLYPGTVTSLRHVYSHPAFAYVPPLKDKL